MAGGCASTARKLPFRAGGQAIALAPQIIRIRVHALLDLVDRRITHLLRGNSLALAQPPAVAGRIVPGDHVDRAIQGGGDLGIAAVRTKAQELFGADFLGSDREAPVDAAAGREVARLATAVQQHHGVALAVDVPGMGSGLASFQESITTHHFFPITPLAQ